MHENRVSRGVSQTYPRPADISAPELLQKKPEGDGLENTMLNFLNPKIPNLVIAAQLQGFETGKVFLNSPTYDLLREARSDGTVDRVMKRLDKRGRSKIHEVAWFYI